MNRLWNAEEAEFLKNNYKNLHYKEIGNVLGRSYKSVSRKAEELGLFKKINKSWTESDLLFLKENYSVMPPIKIAKYLNRSYNSVCSMAQLSNVYTGYKYHTPVYNELFVDNWSRELAYFVGLILSDGHVSNLNFGHFVRLGMCDRDVIEKVKNITVHKGNILKWHKTNGYKTSYIISFYGIRFWNFFTKLGFDNNKSHSAKFPTNVSEEFIPHLIRGVFDGDGSLSFGKKWVSFC